MDFPADLGQLGQNLQTFLIAKGSTLPPFTREKLTEAAGAPSPVDRVVRSAEALYAVHGELDNDGKTMCAQLAQFAALNGWHGMGTDNRGGRIAQAMQREIGEKAPVGKWPAADTDPDVDTAFVEPPEPAAPADPD